MYVSAACFFFWIDGKRSVFIFQEKAGWKAWKGNRRRKHDVLMGLYIQLVSCFRGAKAQGRTPSKYYCNFAFPCTFTWFFLTYDWGNLRQKCFSFHISKKNIIYLYVWSADCNSAIYSELQYNVLAGVGIVWIWTGGRGINFRGPGYHYLVSRDKAPHSKQNCGYSQYYISQATHRSKGIFIVIEGKRGIYTISPFHFIQEGAQEGRENHGRDIWCCEAWGD